MIINCLLLGILWVVFKEEEWKGVVLVLITLMFQINSMICAMLWIHLFILLTIWHLSNKWVISLWIITQRYHFHSLIISFILSIHFFHFSFIPLFVLFVCLFSCLFVHLFIQSKQITLCLFIYLFFICKFSKAFFQSFFSFISLQVTKRKTVPHPHHQFNA